MSPILEPIANEFKNCIAYCPTGSYFICGVDSTDIDVVLLVAGDCTKYLDSSWKSSKGEMYSQAKFFSYRKGKYNLLITNDMLYFKQMRIATDLATRFKLTAKQDRVDLFKAIKGEMM